MKKIVITDYKEFGDISEKKTLVVMGEETMEAQDGYHTFGELYDHRIVLFATLCNFMLNNSESKMSVWKSKLHSDGTMFEGWFVAGLGAFKGEQITYHIPLKDWDLFKCEELGHAPEWDGHTPADVLERLKSLFSPHPKKEEVGEE